MCIYLHELCDITVLFLNLTWKSILFFPIPFVFFSAVSPWYLAGRRAPLKKTTDHLPRCGSLWDPTSLASSKADVFFGLRKAVDSQGKW